MAETSATTFTDPDFRSVIGPAGADLDRVDSTALHRLGTVARDHRGGEYVYLEGAASMAQFDWCVYGDEGFVTAVKRATKALIDNLLPLCIACSAAVAAEYGWFQIKGPAYGSFLVSMAKEADVYSSGTTGSLDDTSSSQTLIEGVVALETEGGTGTDELMCHINHPRAAALA